MFASPLDAALRYASRGWFVFPVRANKHPFTDHGHKDATTDATQLARWWAQWPDAQVGVSCEPSGVAVIDLDYDPTKSKDGPAAWAVVLQDHGGRDQCGLIATTPRGGRHLFYRMPEGGVGSRVDVLPKSGIDVRAVGGYVIVPSPASPGRDWRTGDPFDVDTDGVGDCEAMPQWIRDFVGGTRTRSSSSAGGESTAPMWLDEQTVRSIKDALSHLDNDPHDVWLQVGMALKSTGAQDQAYDLWCEWSQSSPKFQPKAQRRRWNSFKEFRWDGSEITIGTLYYLAREAGWTPSIVQELLGDVALEAAMAQPTEQPRRPFPLHLLEVPGLIGDMVSYYLSSSPRRQPALCLGSVITCLGALLGRRVQTPSGMRTNIYALGIAETGAGKNVSLRAPVRLFALAGLAHWIGSSEWKSDSGLRASLVDEQTRSQVCLIDEFTKFLAAVSSPNAGGHQMMIKRALLELFSCANSTWLPASYADRRLNAPTPIEEPNLCFWGTGVPSELFSSVDSSAVTDGFLNRILVFCSDDGLPQRQRIQAGDPPNFLVEGLKDLERRTRRVGNLHGVCRVVSIVEAAEARLDAIFDRNDQRIRELRRSKQAALADLWVRFGEHVEKLALIRAVSRAPEGQIELADLEWSEELVAWCIERTILEAKSRLADNAIEGAHLRVLRLIRDCGQDGISQADLGKATRWMRRSERKDILASLIEAEEVQIVEVAGTGGRPRHQIVAREFAAER